MVGPENTLKCGFCGYPDNVVGHLECVACGHTPWFQYVPYPAHKKNMLNSILVDDGELFNISKTIKKMERKNIQPSKKI